MNSHESYGDQQKTWQSEIREKLQTSINNTTMIHEHEQVRIKLVNLAALDSKVFFLGSDKETSGRVEARKRCSTYLREETAKNERSVQ